MGRRSLHLVHRRNSSPRLILFAAGLSMLLAGIGARAQGTTPPPPPPDQSAPPPETPGQSQVRAVRISDVEGQVQIFTGDQVTFDQAQPNMPAVEGMRFVTGDNGRLEVEFEDGSVARITPDSSVRLTQLRRNADGSTVTQMDALTGLSYYELNNRGGQYTVHFGSDTATPVQNAVFRVALDTAPSQLAVMHGSVHVDDGQGLSLDVHPSQTFQADPQQPGEFTVAQVVAADSWDQWNSDRDESLARLETSQTTARASSGEPNNPAWNDLDYYGNWYSLPGYGQVWSPAGVGASWDPFGNGAWGYYQNTGYTWISGYPWGWLPYHCGAWDFVDGYGWVWIPGNCGYGFYGDGYYPYSTVWRVPKGYVLPLRPHGAPIHHPGQPRPVNLIAINRGSQYSAPFHFENGLKPAPRPLSFRGSTIQPIEPGIHPIQRGPMGESFTSALVRTHPEMMPSGLRSAPGLGNGLRSTYAPSILGSRTIGAPPAFNAPRAGGYSSGSAGGSHGSFSAGSASHSGGFSGGGASSGGGGFHGGGAVSSGGGAVSAPSAGGGGGGAHH
ncbi:MAG TPA: DUF6600 domain-containing protein [Acidobacteriaceae bacterium]|nr:DUF6600 domain-containing protein [Acidobacteriaceae bacterium]